MCLAPIRLKDNTQVACRCCPRCRDNRINDLVGRCIAEQATSSATFSVTLTYAGDVPEAASLRYKDFQLFIKGLRNDGFKVRYIVAGEYGEKKQRAHWHCVLFFTGKVPGVEINSRIDWPYWPHGYVYFQHPDVGGFLYVLKYALKEQGEKGTRALAMSKKPPLGYKFFMELADDHVERRLPIHSPEYAFAHAKRRNGKTRKFWLQGRMREKFLDRYFTMWRMQHGDDPPWSEFIVEHYWDKIEKDLKGMDLATFERDVDVKRPKRVHLVPYPEIEASDFDGTCGILFYERGNQHDMVVAYPNGSAIITRGNDQWRLGVEIGLDVRPLRAIGLPELNARQVLAWLHQRWQTAHNPGQRRAG